MCLIEMKRVKLADLMPLHPPMTKAKVGRYIKDVRRGDKFPPIVLTKRDGRYWVQDGSHRAHAFVSLGRESISAVIFHPESGADEDLIGELAYALSDSGVPWPVALKVMRTMLGIRSPKLVAQSA